MSELIEKCSAAKAIKNKLAVAPSTEKDRALTEIANALINNSAYILKENSKDIDNAILANMPIGMIDRLKLTEERIRAMADGVRDIIKLNDPVGEVTGITERPNGLKIGKKRVPIGVIGIIYESRPNVTVDAACLCLKSSNAVILRGGKEAINSNIALVEVMRKALLLSRIPQDSIQILNDTSRETATEFMKQNEYLDLLIPRGGAGLIKSVVQNATVPVIETGTGNCHIFVDETADVDMACEIIINAKTQRTSVCNACESLLIHENIAEKILPRLNKELTAKNVMIKACEQARKLMNDAVIATEEDYGTEYLDLIISVKVVADIDEAIEHINKYNTGHSEAIITESYKNSEKFLNEVDAACVYVNASTRFTDGFEFGFGAEIGISTQKLHARGPMGLNELTSYKYIIYGNGQVRG
ncbi:MAG: glutamate-5-semialdehyde dehydrogenase [Clostridia bacterium]|nr:glutamate-5-semialdehyde dehydrogenase [Clostridia bacterium]